MRRTWRALGGAAILVAVMAACGDDDGSSAGSGALEGRTFVSSEVTRPLVAGTQIRLQFVDGEVRATAGCNHLSGSLSIDGERLTVTDLAGTEMGCDPDRHAQDEWLGAFLASGPRWMLDDAALTLTGEEDTIVLSDREVAEPDRPLEGTTWVVDSIVDGDTASSVPGAPDVEASMTFEAGRVSGTDGCNRFNGPVAIGDDSLVFDGIAMTKMACAGDRDVLSRAVAPLLQGTISYEIDGDQLTLTASNGRGLVLRPKA